MSKRKSIATAAVVSPPKRTRRESTRRASTNSKRADDEFVELIDTSVRAQKMRAAEWAKEQKLAKAATPAPKAAKVKAPAARSRKSVAKIESGNESSDDEAPVKKLTVAQQRAKAAAWYKEQLESPVKTPTKPQVTATPTIVKSPVASAKKRVAASRNMKSTIEESESEDNASKDGVVE